MYKFLCARGHVSHSGAINPEGACGHAGCDEGAYRIVTGDEAKAAGANSADCVRFVQYEGVDHCLHLRTGLAYPYRQLRAADRAHLTMRLRSC